MRGTESVFAASLSSAARGSAHHLHMHLVPKYADDDFEWGSTFAMNPDRVHLDPQQYEALAEKIMENL